MEWIKVKLEEIGKVVGGATPSTKNPNYYDGDIPWLSPKDLSVIKDKYITRGERNITQEGYDSCSCKMLPKGSVLFSSRAPIGYIAIAANELCTNQGFKSIIPNEKVNNEFLYYLLTYNKDNIAAQGSGTTFMEVSGKVMAQVEVKIPNDVNYQSRIASILSSLDSKIETNNKINAKLEEMAQALFKSWFVDFEPFKDKRMVESELGMIPEGWRVGSLLDIADLSDSKRKPLSSRQRAEMQGEYPYYGATSIMDYVNDYIFDGTYLLMGEDGSVMKDDGTPYLQYVWGKFWPNNHAHVMQGKNGYSTEMLHCLLSMTNVNHIVTGAVQLKISQQGMSKIHVIMPNQNDCIELDKNLQPIYKQIKTLNEENLRLSQLRDALLPKLMSGEIEI